MRTAIFLAAASAAIAQTSYFPLNPGTQWVYHCTGACVGQETVTYEITQTAQFGSFVYSRFDGMRQPYWLRQSGGSIIAYDPETGQEQLWYAFDFPEGQAYKENLPFCCGSAAIESRAASYKGPVGEFSNALEIRYPGVFQVGVYREIFLAWVGMVQRSQAVGGPAMATYDLIYARVGGVTVITQPEISFGLNFSPASRAARISIRNTSADPAVLTFPSAQVYDVVVRNAAGETVYSWSKARSFALVVQTMTLAPGTEKNYVITMDPLPPGKYTVEAWLTTDVKRWSATLGVDVTR